MGSKPPPPGLVMQQQVRENVTEVQDFLSDLSTWSLEMKAKELANSDVAIPPPQEVDTVPLRNDPGAKVSAELNKVPKVPKVSTDYTSWEKFDAEKACEDIEERGGEGGCGRGAGDNEEEAVRRRAIEMRLEKMANEKKELGNQCLKEKQYEKAVEYYSEGIRCDKKSAVLHANRAQAYLLLKQYDKAAEDCSSAITKDPSYIKAYFRRAKARFHQGKLVDAKNDLTHTLKLEPGNLDAKQLLNDINRKTMQSLLSPTSNTPPISSPTAAAIPTSNKQSAYFPPRNSTLNLRNAAPPPSLVAKLLSAAAALEDDEVVEEKPQDNESYPKPVFPIHKPVSRCSKRPLLPIHVKVVGDDDKRMKLDCNGNEGSSSSNTSSGLTTPTGGAVTPPCTTPSSLPILFSQLQMTSVPPKPKTAAQFNLDWKKLKPFPKFCAQYLNQLTQEDYSIFGESLEYGRLSEMLDLLVWEFLPNKWDIASHLNGLSSVRRFATLTLFMTEKDRANARKLISECSPQLQPQLYQKYSLV